MTDDNTPEVSVEPTQADREAAANGLQRAREAMMDGRLPRCGQIIVAAEEMERAEAILMRREPIAAGLVEQMSELIREMASHPGPEPRFIERARAVVSRLASQTPPATQPSATVGEVEHLRPNFGFETHEPSLGEMVLDYYRRYFPIHEAFNLRDQYFATLHTPPPVAQGVELEEHGGPDGYATDGQIGSSGRPELTGQEPGSADTTKRLRRDNDPNRRADTSEQVLAPAGCDGPEDTTPPPVATATVVDAVRKAVRDAWFDGRGSRGGQYDAEAVEAKWDSIVTRALAATPTPTAGER